MEDLYFEDQLDSTFLLKGEAQHNIYKCMPKSYIMQQYNIDEQGRKKEKYPIYFENF